MPLLIDGYNLLHVTGIFGQGTDLTALHRSREALLRYLAAAIAAGERQQTTIVFDAAGAPPGLPRTLIHDDITVHFSRNYADADAMIEELIEVDAAPKSLVVVSSDHRVQRAARRRGAKAVDSDRWYADLRTAVAGRKSSPAGASAKPAGVLSDEEVRYWMREFDDALTQESASTTSDSPSSPGGPRPSDDVANPFPPGYGDDLLNDFEQQQSSDLD